jgi:peroxiredoxin family protein
VDATIEKVSIIVSKGSLEGIYDLFGIGRYDLIDQVQDIITVGEFYALAAGGQIIFT